MTTITTTTTQTTRTTTTTTTATTTTFLSDSMEINLVFFRKINYFLGWGVPSPPIRKNSAKMINLFFESFS